MTVLVGYLLLFVGVAVFFLFFHLLLGKLIRPAKPDADKLTIYECGEPTVGSAWIQFDLRYYVVALLFVIFDVEVVFFFPWALVFGKACQLASTAPQAERNAVATQLLLPNQMPSASQQELQKGDLISPATAADLAWISFLDILVFFGVLLVGYAYLWKRGDLDWVRSTLSERRGSPVPGA